MSPWWIAASIALFSTSVACEGSQSLGYADVWLRDCDGQQRCEDAPKQHFHVQAFFASEVSRYAPDGLYAYFELERDDGRRAVVELDIPTATEQEAVKDYQISYRELDGERLELEAHSVAGQVILPSTLTHDHSGECACPDALFDLRFVAEGADSTLGTEDDRTRRLEYGHLSPTDTPCAEQLDAADSQELRLTLRSCPHVSTAPAVVSDTHRASSAAAAQPRTVAARSCAWNDCGYRDGYYHDGYYDGYYDEYAVANTGCGSANGNQGCGGAGSEGCGSTEASSSDGCAGDTESGSSGCEGDTSDSPSSCSLSRASAHKTSAFVGTGVPLLLVCAWQMLRSSRLPRRVRKVPSNPQSEM